MSFESIIKFFRDYNLKELDKEELLYNGELTFWLARHNFDFGTHPLVQDKEILGLWGGGVAEQLAARSGRNSWGRTKAAQDFEVLRLNNGKVAYWLAFSSDINGWGETEAAQDFEVHKLRDGEVGRWLAYRFG